MRPEPPIHLLQIVPEKLPTYRADVSALFGRYLPRFGVHCAIVGKAAESASETSTFQDETRVPWRGPRVLAELRFAYVAVRKAMTIPRAKCDIIQARDMVSIGLLLLLVARLRGIPFVYWMSFLMSEGRIANAQAARSAGRRVKATIMLAKARLESFLLYRFLLSEADHVFVQSDTMADFVQARLNRPRDLTPVPMGVDLETIDAQLVPRIPTGWEDKRVIAYLGTLDRKRKISVIVEALSLVLPSYRDARLLFIGTGSDEDIQEIQAAAVKYGISDAIAITGWQPSQVAREFLKAAHVAISPFPRDPIFDTASPTKLLEYLALGVPAVGNDNPDQQQVLTASQAGILTGSLPCDYAQAILEIFDDPQLSRLRASSGPRFVSEHRAYSVIAAKVAACYKKQIVCR